MRLAKVRLEGAAAELLGLLVLQSDALARHGPLNLLLSQLVQVEEHVGVDLVDLQLSGFERRLGSLLEARRCPVGDARAERARLPLVKFLLARLLLLLVAELLRFRDQEVFELHEALLGSDL